MSFTYRLYVCWKGKKSELSIQSERKQIHFAMCDLDFLNFFFIFLLHSQSCIFYSLGLNFYVC